MTAALDCATRASPRSTRRRGKCPDDDRGLPLRLCRLPSIKTVFSTTNMPLSRSQTALLAFQPKAAISLEQAREDAPSLNAG